MTTIEEYATLIRLRDLNKSWEELSDWKHKPSEVGIDRKMWRSLENQGLVESRGFGCRVTITAKMRMWYAAGVDPVGNTLPKEEFDAKVSEWEDRMLNGAENKAA